MELTFYWEDIPNKWSSEEGWGGSAGGRGVVTCEGRKGEKVISAGLGGEQRYVRIYLRFLTSSLGLLCREEALGTWARIRKTIWRLLQLSRVLPSGSVVKNLPAMQETRVQLLGWEGPLEKERATHFHILLGKSRGQKSLAGYSS